MSRSKSINFLESFRRLSLPVIATFVIAGRSSSQVTTKNPADNLPSGAITTPRSICKERTSGLLEVRLHSSKTNFDYGDVSWKPINRITLRAGYEGAFANGNTLFLNPRAPVGPLPYAYQKPYAGFAFDLAKGFTFKTTWTYYGNNPSSIPNPASLLRSGART